MLFLFLFPTLALTSNETKEISDKCQLTVDCYELAEQQWSVCDYIQSTIKIKNHTISESKWDNCKAELNDYRKNQTKLSHIRQKEFKTCLKNISNEWDSATDGISSMCTPPGKNDTKQLIDFANMRELLTNATTRKAVWKMKVEKHKACLAHHKDILKHCTRLRNCCSESKFCDEVYETNGVADTHHKIHRLALKIILKQKECYKLKEAEESDRKLQQIFELQLLK